MNDTDIFATECRSNDTLESASILLRNGTIVSSRRSRAKLSQVSDKFGHWLKSWSPSECFKEIFLPQGFPTTVTPDYIEYQIWDSVQAFASSINGTLASRAVLSGVGVGDSTATIMGATMTWLIKDGAGMIGRIVFAWLKGAEFDADSKKWRLFADALNDASFGIDMLAPYAKPFVTPVLCVSNIARALVGVAGGATRAALTQHQAIANNLADVSAKDGSQETLVNLSALIFSLLLVPLLDDLPPVAIWLFYAVGVAVHLWCNYRAVRALRMRTLNRKRLNILWTEFVANYRWEQDNDLVSVDIVNAHEPLVAEFFHAQPCSMVFGAGLDDLFARNQPSKDMQLWRAFTGRQYIVTHSHGPRDKTFLSQRPSINIGVHSTATVKDSIEAACFAFFLLNKVFLKNTKIDHAAGDDVTPTKDDARITKEYLKQFDALFEPFWDQLYPSVWETSYHLLCFGDIRLKVEADANKWGSSPSGISFG